MRGTSRPWLVLPLAMIAVVPGDLPGCATPSRPSLPVEVMAPGVAIHLVTNEYAHHHPDAPGVAESAEWIATSGSLFRAGSLLWSGLPDDRKPGPGSRTGTDSAVLRVVSRRANVGAAGALVVRLAVYASSFTSTGRTPQRPTDGVNVLLRYHSPQQTYAVSVLRRDGSVAIKKKTPGGPSNGGRYDTLATVAGTRGRLAGIGRWLNVEVIMTAVGSSVRIVLRLDGRTRLVAVDSGVPDPALRAGGRLGLRGDNCDFYIRDLTVGAR
jgi:hypothetical protein